MNKLSIYCKCIRIFGWKIHIGGVFSVLSILPTMRPPELRLQHGPLLLDHLLIEVQILAFLVKMGQCHMQENMKLFSSNFWVFPANFCIIKCIYQYLDIMKHSCSTHFWLVVCNLSQLNKYFQKSTWKSSKLQDGKKYSIVKNHQSGFSLYHKLATQSTNLMFRPSGQNVKTSQQRKIYAQCGCSCQ